MTAEKTPDRQPKAFEGTVLAESFERVLGAGRGEAAGRGLVRRYEELVETYQRHEGEDDNLSDLLLERAHFQAFI